MKRISAVIFDLDGTLTRTPNPWQHIHECLGVWREQASGHFGQWLSGDICYDEFCRKDVELWKGRTVEEIHRYLDAIEPNRHAREVVQALKARKIPSAIISSGFTYIARKIQNLCDWEPIVYANELIEGPDVAIRVSADWSSSISKKAHAAAALDVLQAAPCDTLVVSDALRDLEQLSHCGHHLHVRDEADLLRALDYLD